MLGLHPEHILNRLPQITQDDQAQIRHLSKYIWPKQFKLDHIWTRPASSASSANSVQSTCRELEIETAGPVKTPKRIPTKLVSQLVDRHRQCNFARLLNRHVPSTMKNRVLSQSEKSELLVSLLSTRDSDRAAI